MDDEKMKDKVRKLKRKLETYVAKNDKYSYDKDLHNIFIVISYISYS